MEGDPWLDKWLDLIRATAAGEFVYELGCGRGWDTGELVAAGCKALAADLSESNALECLRAIPQAKVVRCDASKPLPFASGGARVILASLSLHYFPWEVTVRISSELRRCIAPGGLLLARFNSTRDFHHGAGAGEEIEPNFYRVRNGFKRFFDESDARRFLEGWDVRYMREYVMHRYQKPKYVWEAAAVWDGQNL